MARATPSSDYSSLSHYPVKWTLDPYNRSVPVVMQSVNGPCPLLALVNVALQLGLFAIAPGTVRIRQDHLMSILADYVSQRIPANSPQDVENFLEVLPSLADGMLVDVQFSSPLAFETSKPLEAFSLLPNVRLLHGWLVDPEDARLSATLAHMSYNQVLDELVRTAPTQDEQDHLTHIPSAPPLELFEDDVLHKDDENEKSGSEDIEESPHTAAIRELRPLVTEFLESNSTMLTVYGLAKLHETIREGESSILFRNAHFYVIRKHAGELYTLVTDVGYLDELNTVWEKLADVTGDSDFYDGSFRRLNSQGMVAVPPPTVSPPTPSRNSGPPASAHSSPCLGPRPPQQRVRVPQAPQQRMPNGTRKQPRSHGDKCVVQ